MVHIHSSAHQDRGLQIVRLNPWDDDRRSGVVPERGLGVQLLKMGVPQVTMAFSTKMVVHDIWNIHWVPAQHCRHMDLSEAHQLNGDDTMIY